MDVPVLPKSKKFALHSMLFLFRKGIKLFFLNWWAGGVIVVVDIDYFNEERPPPQFIPVKDLKFIPQRHVSTAAVAAMELDRLGFGDFDTFELPDLADIYAFLDEAFCP